MADHEALFSGSRIQGYWQATITCFLLFTWLHLTVGEAVCPAGLWAKMRVAPPHQCLASTSARKQHHLPLHFTSLALSHWLHPAHFNLISLPHVPRPSVGESGDWLLPLSDAGLKLGTFPKDQNKQVRGKDHKTIRIQPKHESSEHSTHTRMNTWLPLCTWVHRLLLSGGGERSVPLTAQKATQQQGSVQSLF